MTDYIISLAVTSSVLIIGVCLLTWQAMRRLNRVKAACADQDKEIAQFIRDFDDRWEQQHHAGHRGEMPRTAALAQP